MGWISRGDDPRTYVYKPRWDRLEDRCPDHLRSSSGMWFFDRGARVGCVIEIKADDGTVLGALVMSGESDPEDPLGKVQRHGVSVFTADEIRYPRR